jgi:monoamine oxidase
MAVSIDPHAMLGYSYSPPGRWPLRAVLAEALGSLHVAGEATNSIRAATVHGAIESGERAAAEITAGA